MRRTGGEADERREETFSTRVACKAENRADGEKPIKIDKNIYFNYSLQVELILPLVLCDSWLCPESFPGSSDRRQAF